MFLAFRWLCRNAPFSVTGGGGPVPLLPHHLELMQSLGMFTQAVGQ